MTDNNSREEQIADLLSSRDQALTSAEVAAALSAPEDEIHETLWGNPSRFVWQPGHRWYVATQKAPQASRLPEPEQPDAVEAVRADAVRPLRAKLLSDGTRLTVRSRALDTDAFFSVAQAGQDVQLTINKAHYAFSQLPTPFEKSEPGVSPEGILLERLLEAWALYESSLGSEADQRSIRRLRGAWGRRLSELFLSD